MLPLKQTRQKPFEPAGYQKIPGASETVIHWNIDIQLRSNSSDQPQYKILAWCTTKPTVLSIQSLEQGLQSKMSPDW